MADISTIHGGTVPGEPDADVIEDLERLLAQARRGSLTGFAYAAIHLDGTKATGWSGVAGTRDPLAAGISILQARYTRALIEGA
ncbi:hypothetical protein [Microbaculum marinum]|uniref:Uncharacterized protein n=1 Tax=Microbaculum marinum TaxID=1764581 RepID=A0AAW9RQQ0_9HYPH